MPSMTRVLAVLLIAAASEISASESTPDVRTIEISPGETIFFQLTRSLSFEVGPIVRVDNPNRDHSLVKATFDVGDDGSGRLRLRNGYDERLSFGMNEACAPQGRSGVISTLRPGVETILSVQAPAKKIVLCNFALMRVVSIDEKSWLKGVIDEIKDQNGNAQPNRQQE